MITASLAAAAIHALLNHDPMSIVCHDESVEIKVKSILDRRTVDLGDKAACFRERRAVKADPIPNRDQFDRGLARVIAASPTNMNAELA